MPLKNARSQKTFPLLSVLLAHVELSPETVVTVFILETPTWLWMYLVCRPCSSSLFPSTSCLYPGLITTTMSTDFWRDTSHRRSAFLCLKATDRALIRGAYVIQKSVHPFRGVHDSGGVVKDVDLQRNTLGVFVKCPWEQKKSISRSHWQNLLQVQILDRSEM